MGQQWGGRDIFAPPHAEAAGFAPHQGIEILPEKIGGENASAGEAIVLELLPMKPVHGRPLEVAPTMSSLMKGGVKPLLPLPVRLLPQTGNHWKWLQVCHWQGFHLGATSMLHTPQERWKQPQALTLCPSRGSIWLGGGGKCKGVCSCVRPDAPSPTWWLLLSPLLPPHWPRRWWGAKEQSRWSSFLPAPPRKIIGT